MSTMPRDWREKKTGIVVKLKVRGTERLVIQAESKKKCAQ